LSIKLSTANKLTGTTRGVVTLEKSKHFSILLPKRSNSVHLLPLRKIETKKHF